MLFRNDLQTDYVSYHSNVQIDVLACTIFFVNIYDYGFEKWGNKWNICQWS